MQQRGTHCWGGYSLGGVVGTARSLAQGCTQAVLWELLYLSGRCVCVCVWVHTRERTSQSAPDMGHEPVATCLGSCQPVSSWEA